MIVPKKTPKLEHTIIKSEIDLLNNFLKNNTNNSNVPLLPVDSPLVELSQNLREYQNKMNEAHELKIEELSRQLKEQNMFMLGVVQGILNPLNGLLGFVDILSNPKIEISPEDNQKYIKHIAKAEDSLVEYIDLISEYIAVSSSDENSLGYCRTKHLIKKIEASIPAFLEKHHLTDKIDYEIVSRNSDFFIPINENVVFSIWKVLINYISILMNAGKFSLQANLKSDRLLLLTGFESKEHLDRKKLNLISDYLSWEASSFLNYPQMGTKIYIAKKYLENVKGHIDFKVLDSKNIQFIIEIPFQANIPN